VRAEISIDAAVWPPIRALMPVSAVARGTVTWRRCWTSAAVRASWAEVRGMMVSTAAVFAWL